MKRSLNAPATEATDCIDNDGHPMHNIIGQTTCYYVNYAKFEEGAAAIEVNQAWYYGPFLGSMIPNMMELAVTAQSRNYLNFVTQLDVVMCSLLKNHTRLDSTVLKTGCRFETFRDERSTLKLVAVVCCCSGKDDPNCKEVTEAVKEKKTLCVGGTDRSLTFYFAKICSHKVVKEYERIGVTNDEGTPTFQHLKALRHTATTAIYEKDATCKALQTVTCQKSIVYDTDEGCCSHAHFCNLHRSLNLQLKRCFWSFGEKQEVDGCRVIFYRADGKWYTSSSLWFEMKQSKLIHLYAVAGNAPYTVSRALLVERNVDPTCSEHTKRYERDYFVISCYGKEGCDDRFTQDDFFKFLDKKVITDAMQKDSLPRCESGNVTFTTLDTVLAMPPASPNTTRVVGLYCTIRLTVGTDEDGETTLNITFGHVFPKPDDCTPQVAERDDLSYSCCYAAINNNSHTDKYCNYATIMETAFIKENDIPNADDTTESVDLIPQQSVYEYADYCEQSNMGDFGVPSLLCQPGGIGCFHLHKMDEARDKVIASCVGHAEEKVMGDFGREEFFDAYHEALLCQAEELKNRCQYVTLGNGAVPKLLCCCQVSVVRNNVAYCVEDTNTMFNAYEYEVKRIGEYRDTKDDDDDGDEDDNGDE
uniref:VWFD domain-containing protein n=1 Tax=Panagrellus redivivus TaxID=6233 RepID=A0A7E4ZXD3_PANRE